MDKVFSKEIDLLNKWRTYLKYSEFTDRET